MPANQLFNHDCKQVSVNCPQCGELRVDVNIVHSILLRHRRQVESFILELHNQANHQGDTTSGTKHS